MVEKSKGLNWMASQYYPGAVGLLLLEVLHLRSQLVNITLQVERGLSMCVTLPYQQNGNGCCEQETKSSQHISSFVTRDGRMGKLTKAVKSFA